MILINLLKYVLLGLIIFCLNACSVKAEQLRIVSYNLESDSIEDTNPRLVAKDIQAINPADIWGLVEVGNADDAQIFQKAIGRGNSDYDSIIGKTGRGDRLQIVFNNQRLKLISSKEIPDMGGARYPLVAHFQFIANNQEFLFVVNHFNRGDSEKRNLQAENFRQWAKAQKLPIIAVGDYNFDVSIADQTGNEAYDIFLSDNTFVWVKPDCLNKRTCPVTGTQCNSRYDSILDFVFLGNQAQQWQAQSDILFKNKSICAKEKQGYSDHYPVAATITLGDKM